MADVTATSSAADASNISADSRYLEGEAVEVAVERVYESIHFDAELADRSGLQCKKPSTSRPNMPLRLLARQLKAELDRLDKQEENLIDLAAEGGMEFAKVRKRLAEIQTQAGPGCWTDGQPGRTIGSWYSAH